MRGRLFVFGLGYTGRRLALALKADGWNVAGTTRTAAGVAALAADGLSAHVHTDETPLDPATPDFQMATHLLQSAPPGEAGDPVLASLADAIGALPHLAWIGYLSTTGVYGDRGGAEVDEASTLRPTGARGARRVQAEAAWRALRPSAHIFRLPGIYGPGRNALQQLRDGRAYRVLKPGHRFSRIHVADIVQTLRASMARPRAGAVYNVCDDLPAESAEVLAYAAELFGVAPAPAVPFEKAELSAMARSFYRDNKTVANGLIKRELGVELRYPTYREGLADLLGDYSAG